MAASVWSRGAVGATLVSAGVPVLVGVAGLAAPRRAAAQNAGKKPAIVVQAPEGEEIWKGFVTGVIEAGLPALEKAAGFAFPEDALDVSFAKDGTATRDLDAVYTGEGRLLVRKTGKRKGVRGHAILTALAHAFSQRVTEDAWLQEVLAYLYTYHALEDLPQIYHPRTFLLEVLTDARKAKQVVLDKWEPGPVTGLTADPAIAVAFAYMYATDRTLGDAALKEAGAAIVADGDPVGFADFEAALAKAAGKPVRPYFLGWYHRKKKAGDGEPAFKVQDLYDPDHDLLLNFEEKQAGTDPKKADTDDDGRLDGAEVFDLHSDPTAKDPRAKVPIDGNFRKWLRLKKFKSTDKKGDAKVKVAGADLVSYAITSDDTFLYVLVESDAMSNPKVVYNVAFDREGDRIFDVIFSFRSTRQRWFVDTHGQKDLSWAEYKNNRRMSLFVRGKQAEARIPLKALGIEGKVTVLVYTRAKGPDGKTKYADACAREKVDLDRWKLKK